MWVLYSVCAGDIETLTVFQNPKPAPATDGEWQRMAPTASGPVRSGMESYLRRVSLSNP
jgi:hypothetical protein